jgi:hypothetical protein
MLTATRSPLPTPISTSTANGSSSVSLLGQRKRLPLQALVASQPSSWLKLLMVIQRGSTPITLVLGTVLLGVYGWSVYSQRSWSQAYSRLNQLQRDERQLITANETRKFQVTEQAETTRNQFVPQAPTNTIFLKPASSRPAKAADANSQLSTEILSPAGY